MGASIAALGLSNKAVYAGEEPAGAGAAGGNYTEGPDLAPNPMPSAVAGPPLEEHLAQNTLWPEVVKLYGHANHILCLAADPLGKYLASACKARLHSLTIAHQPMAFAYDASGQVGGDGIASSQQHILMPAANCQCRLSRLRTNSMACQSTIWRWLERLQWCVCLRRRRQHSLLRCGCGTWEPGRLQGRPWRRTLSQSHRWPSPATASTC